jgi:hypothetical protein
MRTQPHQGSPLVCSSAFVEVGATWTLVVWCVTEAGGGGAAAVVVSEVVTVVEDSTVAVRVCV